MLTPLSRILILLILICVAWVCTSPGDPTRLAEGDRVWIQTPANRFEAVWSRGLVRYVFPPEEGGYVYLDSSRCPRYDPTDKGETIAPFLRSIFFEGRP